MTTEEKLEILNSLEVVDQDGGDSFYVAIDNNEDNREALISIGCTEEEINKCSFDDYIDLSQIAFEYGAVYYTGSKFIQSKQELFNDLKNAVDDYWEKVNSNPLMVGEATKKLIRLTSQYVDLESFEQEGAKLNGPQNNE